MKTIEYINLLDIIILRLKELERLSVLNGKKTNLDNTIMVYQNRRDVEWKKYIENYKFLK